MTDDNTPQTRRGHSIHGYKRNGCRCDICCTAYLEYRRRQRKHPEDTFRIDPEPLIAFIESRDIKVMSLTYKMFDNWREKGGVDVFTADKQCCRRGVHPWEVYGDYWYTVQAG